MSTAKTTRRFWSRLNFRNWRISTKLLVVMISMALVPVILVTVSGTQTGREALVYEAQVNLTRLANSTAQRFEQLLLDNQNYIRLTAGQEEVITYLSLDPAERSAEMYADLNDEIYLLLNSNNLINLVSIFDNLGIVKAHTSPQYIGLNYFFRDYVQAALNGKSYTTGITIGVLDNKPGVLSSTPVWSSNGEVVGVISSRIKGDYITQILESTLDLEAEDLAAADLAEIDIYLVNEYGLVMSHSDSESEWLYRSIGEIREQGLVDRIVDDKLLGGDCPADTPGCDASEKIGRRPIPMLALHGLRDELMTALSAGETGTYIYCRPTDLDGAMIEPENCPNAQSHIIGYAPVNRPGSSSTDASLFMVVVD
ncbi:MAG: cache domain-containing protein, partial [Anaerolineales bacterium]|nr:cache domain-containing protein [Anaerolineales bacterium]